MRGEAPVAMITLFASTVRSAQMSLRGIVVKSTEVTSRRDPDFGGGQ